MKKPYFLLLFILIFSCTERPSTPEEELYSFMQGSFTSEKQAQENSRYYNVTLQLTHIWEEREGKWLYAEYGLSESPNPPYAQRIFKIKETPEARLELESYDIGEREKFAGKWQNPSFFDSITEQDLTLRKGCKMVFQKQEASYIGETEDKNCKRILGTANYSIHKFHISENEIINWARGFDANNNLVWGYSDGGYVLKRVEEM